LGQIAIGRGAKLRHCFVAGVLRMNVLDLEPVTRIAAEPLGTFAGRSARNARPPRVEAIKTPPVLGRAVRRASQCGRPPALLYDLRWARERYRTGKSDAQPAAVFSRPPCAPCGDLSVRTHRRVLDGRAAAKGSFWRNMIVRLRSQWMGRTLRGGRRIDWSAPDRWLSYRETLACVRLTQGAAGWEMQALIADS
jgi:hypothetical protein